MYTVRPPYLLTKFYHELNWYQTKRKDPTIYLTFDDGPLPEVTPFVLKTLKSYDIRATFFCIGDNIKKYPAIFEAVKDNGHQIGNHTFHHLNGWKTDNEKYFENIAQCQELTQSDLFRPPYGRIKKSQIRTLRSQYKIIMWNVLSGDFDSHLSASKCFQNVVQKTKANDIVVFHDSLKAFDRLEYTLPKAIEFWIEKGFNFDII